MLPPMNYYCISKHKLFFPLDILSKNYLVLKPSEVVKKLMYLLY